MRKPGNWLLCASAAIRFLVGQPGVWRCQSGLRIVPHLTPLPSHPGGVGGRISTPSYDIFYTGWFMFYSLLTLRGLKNMFLWLALNEWDNLISLWNTFLKEESLFIENFINIIWGAVCLFPPQFLVFLHLRSHIMSHWQSLAVPDEM